jgi:small subunit ribosomal protein S8
VPDLLPIPGPPRRVARHHQVKLVSAAAGGATEARECPANDSTTANDNTTPKARKRRTERQSWAPPAPTDHAEGPRGNHGEEGHQAMTMTDPVADMLTRLRNANSAYHDSVTMPHSKIKVHIAEILQQEGYIASWRVEDAEVGKNLIITLKFGPTRERSIAGLKRVSKPGLRVYARKDNLPRVLGGLGVAIISTSSGLMTDRQAKKKGVGGEVLAYVW